MKTMVCEKDTNSKIFKLKGINKAKVCYICSIVIVMALALFWCFQKKGMFLDEIYSYGLSNGYFTPFLKAIKQNNIIDTVFSKKELFDYLTVSAQDSFKYDSVFYNQMQDVHPPLFYVCLHTLSSIFPNIFTKWTGLGLNLVYFLITLIFIGKISNRLFDNQYISASMIILYGCTSCALSNVIFIRMYMLSTMFTVILAWLVLNVLNDDKWINYILCSVVVCAGLLTHYFFVFYAFFISAFIVIYLLSKKNYSKEIKTSIFLILGVVVFIGIFPACLEQITKKTGTGFTTVDYIKSFNLLRLCRIAYNLAANYFFPIIIGLVLLAFSIKNYKKVVDAIKNKSLDFTKGFIIVIPAVISFFVIILVSNETIYVTNITPFFIFIVGYLIRIFITINYNKNLIKWLMISITLLPICLSFCFKPKYLYTEYENYNEMINDSNNYSCLYITENRNPSITQDIIQLLNFDEIVVVENENSLFFESNISRIHEKDGLVVFFASYPNPLFNDEALSNIAKKTGFSTVKFMYNNGWSNVYKLTISK